MPNHDPERRLFLARTITIGTALSVFPVLVACRDRDGNAEPTSDQSRPNQDADERPGMPEDKSTTAREPGDATNKMTKSQAQYQEKPKGNQQCSNCVHYLAESGSCKLVEGSIAPDAWCMLWSEAS